MAIILRTSRQLPEPGAYDLWFSVTDTLSPPLPQSKKMPELAAKLEDSFNGVRDVWWKISKIHAASKRGAYVHAFSSAPVGSDLGLMMAWVDLAARQAQTSDRVLVVCDDPWLFRELSTIENVQVGTPPPLFPKTALNYLRGFFARLKLAIYLLISCIQLRSTRKNITNDSVVLLPYGHPNSTSDGIDAYFGDLMRTFPDVCRLLHSDSSIGRTLELAEDGRTSCLHAWGSPFFAISIMFFRWSLGRLMPDTQYPWLLRRVSSMEGSRGIHAMNKWFHHCSVQFLKTVSPKTIAWSWENLPWERILCREAQKAGVRTVGYQDTDVGPHQFNMSGNSNHDPAKSLPDYYLLNGSAYSAQMIAWGLPAQRFLKAGAYRIPYVSGEPYDPEGPIFVALSGVLSIAEEMLAAVQRARTQGRRFLIKEHPMYPIEFDVTEDVQRTNSPLLSCQGLSGVIFSTGMSGLEGLLLGLPTVRLLLDDRISLNTLPEGLQAQPATKENLPKVLDNLVPRKPVKWESLFCHVDLDVWRETLQIEE